MSRIVFHGNCQIGYISRVFADQIAPHTGDTSRYFDLNFTDFAKPDVRDAFHHADIIVDQVFDSPDTIPAELIDRNKKHLRIPNMRGDFLWPFGTRDQHPRHEALPAFAKHYYGYEFGDSYLNRMILKGVDPAVAVDGYMRLDFTRQRNLPRIFEISMDRQRRRDHISGISICDFILGNLNSCQLFYSPGHPCEQLLHLIARPVLAELAGNALAEQALAGQFQGFSSNRIAPIHPNVAATLGIGFISANTLYQCYDEGLFNFEQYALRYMRLDCVPEMTEAVKRFNHLDGRALLTIASTALQKAPMSPLAHRLLCQALRRLGQPTQAIEPAFRSVCLEPDNAHNLIELITVLAQANDLPAAESWARLAVSKFPREAPVYLCLCDVLSRQQNHADVARFAAHAARLHPGHGFTLLRAARHLLNADQLSQAGDLLERLKRLGVLGAEAAQLQIDILDRSGQRGAAIDEVRAAASRTQDAQLYGRLGHLLSQENDHTGAEDAYRRAIAINPRLAGFHGGLAESLQRQGRPNEAIAALQSAVEVGHGDMHTVARLAHLLGRCGEYAKAEAAYRRAIECGPEVASFHIGLAEMLDALGKRGEAIEAARVAAGCANAGAGVHAYLAHLLFHHKEFGAAESSYRKAIELDAKTQRYRTGLAATLESLGRRQEAIAVLRAAPTGTREDAHLFARLGALLHREGDPAGAESAYRDALRIDPRQAGHHVGLAEALERQGRAAEAVAVIRAALLGEHNNARMYGHLGYFLDRAGDPAAAEDSYRVAIAMDPSVPGLQEGLSRVLGRSRAARTRVASAP